MSFSNPTRSFAVLLLSAFVCALAACGGDDDTTVPAAPYQIDSGGNYVAPLDIEGPSQYIGQQPEEDPVQIDPVVPPDVPQEAPFEFGDNIFAVPLDTNGAGRIVASSFSPGQRVAFIMVNLNPAWRDAHALPTGVFLPLPDSRFTITANLVTKGSAMVSADELAVATTDSLGPLGGYSGIDYAAETQHPFVLHERDALAQGVEPFAPQPPAKSTSAIQKGELRWFIQVAPRPSWPPRPIPPDPEDPEQDTSGFLWPPGYNCQIGRLTTIGAHCLVFLTTAINDGHPDKIQFTEDRLYRLAREFDTVIFPIATTSYGEVVSYGETNVMRDIDRYLEPPITGADFDANGEFLRDLPGDLDAALENEDKINIFIYDGADGGFYIGAPLQDEDVYGEPHAVGSTIYIGSDNFPPNDNSWDASFSIMAHEFQHKLYSDHGMPMRLITGGGGNYNWLNEGMSQLDIHLCGYTVNSGRIVPWAIDGQLTDYLSSVNLSAVCMDGNTQFPHQQQTQYGNGFLFFLYLHEHYNPGVAKRIYALGEKGETDYITLVEAGAQWTDSAGPDRIDGTADDKDVIYYDTFEQIYTKFVIANFIDGVYKDNESDLFDPRFHYNTIDLRGTVNLATGTIVLPGVRTSVFPEAGGYPVQSIDRKVIPWGCDYLVFSNGDGRDLEVTVYTDPYFKMFMLPVTYNTVTNKVDITPGVTLNY